MDYMDYKEASRIYTIPVAALYMLKKEGVIGEPLTLIERAHLLVVSKIWGKNAFLRMQLSRKTKKVRLKLIEKPELTRVERHILTRFRNHYEQNNGEWLYREVVEKEVSSLFKIPLDQRLRDTVRKMRQKAKNDIKKAGKVSE